MFTRQVPHAPVRTASRCSEHGDDLATTQRSSATQETGFTLGASRTASAWQTRHVSHRGGQTQRVLRRSNKRFGAICCDTQRWGEYRGSAALIPHIIS